LTHKVAILRDLFSGQIHVQSLDTKCERVLRQVQASIAAKRVLIPIEEARALVWIALIGVQSLPLILSLTQLKKIGTNE
jgi:hypothetical protein